MRIKESGRKERTAAATTTQSKKNETVMIALRPQPAPTDSNSPKEAGDDEGESKKLKAISRPRGMQDLASGNLKQRSKDIIW